MWKRNVWRMLALLLAGVCLSGCGKGEDTEAGSDTIQKETERQDSDIVQLSVWDENTEDPMLTQMIESFKEEYKGQAQFEITLVQSEDSGAKDSLLSDVHNAADVFPLADDQLTGMVAAGAIEAVPNPDEIRAANIPESVDAASVNGTLYAYPMTADNGYFMYYNKKYFTEKDVETLDGMLAAAEKAKKKISMEATSGWYLYTFFGNTGMEFGLNDDGITNYCNWNTTEGDIKGTDIVESLLDIFGTGAFISAPDGELIENVQSGEVIAAISGIWNAIKLQEIWGDDCGAVKLPTYTCAGQQIQMSSFTGYKMMGVNYYSKHKEWACKLADWLTNEQNQNLRFEAWNQGPSNINAAASEEIQKVPAIQAVIAQSAFGSLQRVGNSYWTPFQSFAETIAAGNPDNIKPQDLIDTLVAGITASSVQ